MTRTEDATMGWFTNLCRNLGLMVHHIRHPESGERRTKTVDKRTEERREENGVIVRRTTIEEIEFPPDHHPTPRTKSDD